MVCSLDGKDREKFMGVLRSETQNPVVMYGWSAWLGMFGIDRFIVGDVKLGILKLITLGGFGVWWIIDCFLIGGRTRQANMEKALYIYETIQKRDTLRD